jgi:short-subunit dehydrogenase
MLWRMSQETTPLSPRGTALVTGATAGIGLEFARQLAARGHDLVLVARNRPRLEQVAHDLGSSYGIDTEVLVADLADREQLATVAARLADPARPVAVLVNNAGFGLKGRFLDNSIEQEQAMLDVLVTAVLRLSHAALGPMVARGSGAVLNVSSVAGFLPRGTYGAAKAWVTRFSVWAHHEYRPRGVQVMAVVPGFVRTEFHERMDVDQSSAPAFLWLEASRLVRDALADLDAGRGVSVPSKRYRAIVAAAQYVPSGLLQRFQSFGRK